MAKSADISSNLVQEIMRWDMAVLRESPWYQQILLEGEARGMRQGILSAIELGLELKFGSQGLQLMSQVSQIEDSEQLKVIREKIKINTLEQLQQLISGF